MELSGIEYIGCLTADAPEAEAKPKRVAVDETAVKINGEWPWIYAAINLETKLILGVALFGRHGTDPAAAFLHGLRERYDLSNTGFLVDQFGYRTALSLSRLGLNGQVNYTDRNLIEKWFTPSKCESTVSITRGWQSGKRTRTDGQFVHYYNRQRPHQSLDGKTPAEELLN